MAVERTSMTQVRQGDVLLTPQPGFSADELATVLRRGRDLVTQKGVAVLAVGKGGGHPHQVVGENVSFVESDNDKLLKQQPDDVVTRVLHIGEGGATLEHDEHENIHLPAGSTYVVYRQLETLVGDDNNPTIHQTTGIIANDRAQPSRRYVED